MSWGIEVKVAAPSTRSPSSTLRAIHKRTAHDNAQSIPIPWKRGGIIAVRSGGVAGTRNQLARIRLARCSPISPCERRQLYKRLLILLGLLAATRRQ